MGGMAPAPAAVLFHLNAVRRVSLGLGRLVVPPLACSECKRDGNSDSGFRHLSTLCRRVRVSSGGRTRTSDTRIMIPLL